MTQQPFSVRMAVRSSDLDPQFHVNGSVYIQFANHSQFMCIQAAGVSIEDLVTSNLGPVTLETSIRYRNELRGGDEVDVDSHWIWGDGKTYRLEHVLRRMDGKVAAEVTHVSALLDLTARHLVADPAHEWRIRAEHPEVLGLV